MGDTNLKEKKIIADMKENIKNLQAEGHKNIPTAGLLKYLDAVEGDVESSTAIDTLKHEIDMFQLQTAHERNLAHYRPFKNTQLKCCDQFWFTDKQH